MMYISGIGPKFLPTAVRVDYMTMVSCSRLFFCGFIRNWQTIKDTKMEDKQMHTNTNSWILKGMICYSKSKEELSVMENGYLVCCQGICQGVFPSIPEEFKSLPLTDYQDALIFPGMTDLHLHAPQYPFCGLGMDLELLEWLENHTFPEESRYCSLDYARQAYGIFTEDLKASPTTRAVIFSTIHSPATKLLMDLLEDTGLATYVGKVNMDQNCPDFLRETDAHAALEDTRQWLKDTMNAYQHTKPILTPRFAPTCSAALMEGLGKLQREYGLPVQSHLSENLSETAWVKELFPWSSFYGDVYDRFGLFGSGKGNNAPAVMAHCVHSPREEVLRMKEKGVFVAHCPQSNTNLSSGIAPIRSYLEEGLFIGLGTDLAGGTNLSMFRCITDAIAVSKLYWRLVDQSAKPLTLEEGFYLATIGGGSFFGKVGSFEKGYEADVLVADDSLIPRPQGQSIQNRLARFIYLSQEKGKLIGKYVAGRKIF